MSPASRSPGGGGRPLAPEVDALVGIGLRAPHYRDMLDTLPAIGWLEVHSENFFGEGGQPHWFLERLRAHYSLSLHGVGLGIGSVAPLSQRHLDKLAGLIARYEPFLVSEHLCWNAVAGKHLNDLLPLPYTEEALAHVCRRVEAVQSALRRRVLIENISSYIRYPHSTIPEWEFLAALARRTGCGILLDVNNIFVSATNAGFDPHAYLSAMPSSAIGEMHLAGFEAVEDCLIDTHSRPVSDAVWRLYEAALATLGPRPTLIEWDKDIPPLADLLGEAGKAQRLMAHEDALAG
ncbi:MAG TPA: DUF692 domain-containing protein [Burkholderiales bacterium]|nr:DUF692 domain-containing protein [Burkholderiales bacterium]